MKKLYCIVYIVSCYIVPLSSNLPSSKPTSSKPTSSKPTFKFNRIEVQIDWNRYENPKVVMMRWWKNAMMKDAMMKERRTLKEAQQGGHRVNAGAVSN